MRYLKKYFWFIVFFLFTSVLFFVDSMDITESIPEESSNLVAISDSVLRNKITSNPETCCVLYYMRQSPYYASMEKNLNGLVSDKYNHIPAYKLDLEQYPEPFYEHNLSGSPVLVFYKDGKEINRVVGKVSPLNLDLIFKRTIK